MVDINSFFYDDFPIEEIKSLPKLAADKMGWINCLPSQVQEILAQWCIAMPAEPAGPREPWRPTAAAQFAHEYWSKLTADAVKASAFFYGCMHYETWSSDVQIWTALFCV